MHNNVVKSTYTDAESPSPPNFTANNAVLVADGIENKKNRTYLIEMLTGKNATSKVVIRAIIINLKKHTTYAHLSINSCLIFIFARRIPITVSESGVTILPTVSKLPIILVKALCNEVPLSTKPTTGFLKIKK
jgi:hypothetical protein